MQSSPFNWKDYEYLRPMSRGPETAKPLLHGLWSFTGISDIFRLLDCPATTGKEM